MCSIDDLLTEPTPFDLELAKQDSKMLSGPLKELQERARCRIAGAWLRRRLENLLTRPITRPTGVQLPPDRRIGPIPPPPPLGPSGWGPTWSLGPWIELFGPVSAGPQPEPPTLPELDPAARAEAWRAMSAYLRDLADALEREVADVPA